MSSGSGSSGVDDDDDEHARVVMDTYQYRCNILRWVLHYKSLLPAGQRIDSTSPALHAYVRHGLQFLPGNDDTVAYIRNVIMRLEFKFKNGDLERDPPVIVQNPAGYAKRWEIFELSNLIWGQENVDDH